MLQRVRPQATNRFDEFDVALYSEQLHLRNYDEVRRYEVTVRVTGDGQKHEQTYDLSPMEQQSVIEIVPPDRYDVYIKGEFYPTVDHESAPQSGTDTDRAACNVGNRPPQTILVECGNGIVTLSEGLL